MARRIIVETVRQVGGVLPDKPVDVLYHEMGESAMIFRVRWWLESYVDTRRMFDKVNEALLEGFNEAGINLPNMTYDLNLKVDEGDVINTRAGARHMHVYMGMFVTGVSVVDD